MADPYGNAKGGRLTFKGGSLASRSKSIDKKTTKKERHQTHNVTISNCLSTAR